MSAQAFGPRFWSNPIRFCRWAARERPSYFWSCVIAGIGPIMVVTVPPIRHRLGDVDAPPIPLTYPVPTGPRKKLTGYDDDTETS
ncbi:hypothetical protein B0H66DRAFT_544011 [Apodospora peruviana]|uniref:NADH-ubiquinone oxidoreductase 9.5 kDa subunit n=1 Tax=Apodospora peruviana TaxID=516989 RepID=A0AAE0MFB9_9PEZI|nr:hypothetical protein B0H66DRAFT_544011 [Apodospora peruviana]